MNEATAAHKATRCLPAPEARGRWFVRGAGERVGGGIGHKRQSLGASINSGVSPGGDRVGA